MRHLARLLLGLTVWIHAVAAHGHPGSHPHAHPHPDLDLIVLLITVVVGIACAVWQVKRNKRPPSE